MSSIPPPARSVRIVHLIAGLQASGAEIALLRLATRSAGEGLRHTIVSLTGRGDLAEEMEAAGCEVVSLNLRASPALPIDLCVALRRIVRLKPDIIQGWMVHGNLAAWAARLLLHRRAKLAWNLRMSLKNAVHEAPRTMALTKFARNFSRSVDLLISNSAAGLEDHLALGYAPRASAVIPNGYDPMAFAPDTAVRHRMRNAWGLPNNAVVYGLIGRYHAVKGHDVLIRAAALCQGRSELFFVLAGRDASPNNPELMAALEQNGLVDRFRLLGARNDVSDVLRGLDVVCVPSAYEGFPNALGEAMTAGLPCIATDVSDVSIIMGDAGRLIPVGDERALAEAITELLDCGPERRADLGRSARQRILEHYTLSRAAVAYAERYLALVEPAAPRSE